MTPGDIGTAEFMCSTPGGIGAVVGGCERDFQYAVSRVLNARRHRSCRRRLSSLAVALQHLCSTPGGIGAVVGLARRPELTAAD